MTSASNPATPPTTGRSDAASYTPRHPQVFEFSELAATRVLPGGGRWWAVRAQNFTVLHVDLCAGESLSLPTLHAAACVLIPQGCTLFLETASEEAPVWGPALAIVPPGPLGIHADVECSIQIILASVDSGCAGRAVNEDAYVVPDVTVAPLPRSPGTEPDRLRIFRMDELAPQGTSSGRIVQTRLLMINWLPGTTGPRNTNSLSPHSHDDFEQCSLTLDGPFVHHFRTPWTSRLSDWRDDVHSEVRSPSATIIPPRITHTTRATGKGSHVLVDVFAPPRADFIAKGWVLNEHDYDS